MAKELREAEAEAEFEAKAQARANADVEALVSVNEAWEEYAGKPANYTPTTSPQNPSQVGHSQISEIGHTINQLHIHVQSLSLAPGIKTEVGRHIDQF